MLDCGFGIRWCLFCLFVVIGCDCGFLIYILILLVYVLRWLCGFLFVVFHVRCLLSFRFRFNSVGLEVLYCMILALQWLFCLASYVCCYSLLVCFIFWICGVVSLLIVGLLDCVLYCLFGAFMFGFAICGFAVSLLFCLGAGRLFSLVFWVG